MSIRSSAHSFVFASALSLLGVVLLALAAPSVQAQAKLSQKHKAQAKEHYKRGRAYHDLQEYGKAIEEYQLAYKLSKAPKLLFNIAQAHRLQGDRENSIKYYDLYLAKEPDGDVSSIAREQRSKLRRELKARESALRTAAARRAEKQRKAQAREERQAQEQRKRAQAREERQAQEQRKRAQAREERQAQEQRKKAPRAARRAEKQREAKLSPSDRAAGPAATETQGAAPTGPPAEKPTNRILRIAGMAAGGTSLLAFGLGLKYSRDASSISDEVSNATWTPDLTQRIEDGEAAERTMKILYGVGATAPVFGGVLYYLGVRRPAGETLNRVVILPSMDDKSSGIVVSGQF